MSSWQMFFLGGGKSPNLGVVNVRILGVVNVRLANNLTPYIVDNQVVVRTSRSFLRSRSIGVTTGFNNWFIRIHHLYNCVDDYYRFETRLSSC